jgi:hypothetical protein
MVDPRALAVAVILAFAGCAGAPSSDPTPTETPDTFTLEVETTSGERVVVSVALVETLSGVAVDYDDGRTDRFEGVTDPADLPGGALDGAVRVRPLDEVTDATAIDLAGSPGTVEMPLEGDPQFALYVVSVPGDVPPGDDGDGQPVPATDARVREWGVARCEAGGVVDSLTVRVSPDGVSGGHACAF